MPAKSPETRDESSADVVAAELSQSDKPEEQRCPNCNGPLNRHPAEDPIKGNCLHCDHCGICWQPDLKAARA